MQKLYLRQVVQLALLHLAVAESSTLRGVAMDASSGVACPTWFREVLSENGTYTCHCGRDLPLSRSIYCSEQPPEVKINVIFPVCISYDTAYNATLAGACPYTVHTKGNTTTPFYLTLPANSSEVNDYMCGPLNREGLLCGQCKDGYAPAVLSYDRKCVECSSGDAWNWAIFFSVTLLPTTILYLGFMVFQVNVNSPPLSAFVYISQAFSVPFLIERIQYGIEAYPESTGPLLIYNICTTLYGIWNLDFLRVLIPPYCLPGVKNSVHALAVEYFVALYPLLLVVLTYSVIKLHARDTRIVVALWRPFHRCFVRLRRTWDPNASVVNGFATFLLLSYWKIAYISMSLLLRTSLISPSGEVLDTGLFLYDASVRLFHGEHLVFATVAIGVFLVFVVLPPIVLLLYPTKAVQKCLQKLRVRTVSVSAFMDVFQGHFKDGTGGTWDWRSFSAVYLLVRFIGLAALCFTDWTTYVFTMPVLLSMYASVLLILLIGRPYKKLIHNFGDVFLFLLAVCFASVVTLCGSSAVVLSQYPLWLEAVGIVVYALPHVFLGAVCVWWLEARHGCIKLSWQTCKRKCLHRAEEVDLLEIEELPDRLENPQNY